MTCHLYALLDALAPKGDTEPVGASDTGPFGNPVNARNAMRSRPQEELRRLLSRRVAKNESKLLKLISDVLDVADGRPTTWAMDMAARKRC